MQHNFSTHDIKFLIFWTVGFSLSWLHSWYKTFWFCLVRHLCVKKFSSCTEDTLVAFAWLFPTVRFQMLPQNVCVSKYCQPARKHQSVLIDFEQQREVSAKKKVKVFFQLISSNNYQSKESKTQLFPACLLSTSYNYLLTPSKCKYKSPLEEPTNIICLGTFSTNMQGLEYSKEGNVGMCIK